MALTPLTVTRRNVVALDFTSTTLIPGTTGTVAYNYSGNQPYPQIVSSGGDGDLGIADGGTADRHTRLYINGDGVEFGIYYEFAQRGGGYGGGPRVALSRDETEFVITNNTTPAPPATGRTHRTVPADIDQFMLSVSRLPPDGSLSYPTGYEGIQGGGDAYYPVYNIGGVNDQWANLAVKFADSEFRLFKMSDGSEYRAFASDADFFHNCIQMVTLSDENFNYSLLTAEPLTSSGNTLYMSKWTAEDPLDPLAFTNYALTLSDAADDAILQAAADYDFGDLFHMRGNYENFWLAIIQNDTFPLTEMTVFVFAKDFTWYDRLDITTNGDINFGTYWLDNNCNHFIVGTHQTESGEAFQMVHHCLESEEVEDEDTHIRVWPFSLDGHDYAVFRLGTPLSLIYDLTTDQWARWYTPDIERWRPHVGQNWSGMGPVTWARGFGSDVVCGDDREGVLYILDPTAGRDDDVTTGTPTEFTRRVTGLVQANGRESKGIGAVTLDIAKGDPSQTGATITLRTSADGGHNFLNHGSHTIVASEWGAVIEWRALGQIRAPGRIFEISDNGATVRISSADMR